MFSSFFARRGARGPALLRRGAEPHPCPASARANKRLASARLRAQDLARRRRSNLARRGCRSGGFLRHFERDRRTVCPAGERRGSLPQASPRGNSPPPRRRGWTAATMVVAGTTPPSTGANSSNPAARLLPSWLLVSALCPIPLPLLPQRGPRRVRPDWFPESKLVHGGGTFVWPIIQEFRALHLEPFAVEVPLEKALSLEKVRVSVPSVFTLAIGTSENIMYNASLRLLDMDHEGIEHQALEIITGQLRQVIASMTIEQINRDRERFEDTIRSHVGKELKSWARFSSMSTSPTSKTTLVSSRPWGARPQQRSCSAQR